MTFGRQSGPPASSKQMEYLRALVQKAGHDDLRSARHPLGLTQRQAGGKFTKGEASALIDRLLDGGGTGDGPPAASSAGPVPGGGEGEGTSFGHDAAAERLEAEQAELLRGMPAGLIAGELERRGWQVTSPF
jgi:hypothetical protein